jgi:hypothetical protein
MILIHEGCVYYDKRVKELANSDASTLKGVLHIIAIHVTRHHSSISDTSSGHRHAHSKPDKPEIIFSNTS